MNAAPRSSSLPGDVHRKMGNDSSLPCDTLPRGLLPAYYTSLRRILGEHNMRRLFYKVDGSSCGDVCRYLLIASPRAWRPALTICYV
jgi:hypothetical protein